MDERYQNGKIYRLTCDDPTMVYYGSTIQTLKQRLSIHKGPNNNTVSRKMRDVGGLQIELLEHYQCNSRRELEEREQYFIDNNNCINFKSAFITEQQRLERDKKCVKTYHEANKQKRAEYQKAYRAANREKAAENKKAWSEANREKLLKYKKAWYAANKEKKAEYNKAYRAAKII
jgi:hypothetical protein